MSEDRWAEARRRQRRLIAAETTIEQRLAWLEEAIEVARESGALERALREHDEDPAGRRSA